MNDLEELKGIEPEAGAVAPVEPITEAAPVEGGQQTEAAPAPEPSAIAGLRRDFQAKLTARDQELADAKAKLEAFERQQPRDQPKPEPQGEMSEADRVRNDMLFAHEAAARAAYGAPAVSAAQKWFQQANDPALAFEVQNSRFPYETLMENFKGFLEGERLRSLYEQGFDPSDPDSWAKKRAAELAAAEREDVAASQQPATRAPPRSIASTPSSGGSSGTTPSGPGQAFDAEFG